MSFQAAATSNRDRFLALAFAAADLLLEIGPGDIIAWAGGAFATRFGQQPEAYIGQNIATLIAPGERDALGRALAVAARHGRLPPTLLRLNDAGATACSFAALALPGSRSRLCISIGPLPAAPPPPREGLQSATGFAREAEAWLRAGLDGALGLIDVKGWSDAVASLSVSERDSLRQKITAALLGLGGPGNVFGEMADGRYGVLSQDAVDLARLAATVADALNEAGWREAVESQSIALATDRLSVPQAARALRFALGRFATGGTEATEAAGFRDGLVGFIAAAGSRTEAMRATIGARRFRLVFQPVVKLADRRVHHYEALLRPIATQAVPFQTTQEFVTFAEALGLSEDLDLAVLEVALAALAETTKPKVAVNISGLSMQSTRFREDLRARLSGRVPGRLLIELTETAEIEDVPAAADTLDQLRAAGIPVCIDDFGAGSAAFRYLRDFRVDYVKIDGAYVHAAMRNARDRTLVASMRDVAHSVGAEVVAEMIETEEAARLMRELGVSLGQGWLFGRPGALPGARSRRF